MTYSYIDIHTHHININPSILALYVQPLNNFDPKMNPYCLGLHPWDRTQLTLKEWQIKYDDLLTDPNCVAIGEVGIDLIKQPQLDYQEYLSYFFDKANLLNKPIVLHIVKAYQELMTLLDQKKVKVPIIIHAFNGPNFFLKKYSHQEIYYSLGPRELKKNNKDVNYKKLLLDKVLLETDDSTLTIAECYQKASSYFNIDLTTLHNIVKKNVKKIFNEKF